jgi:hypothetical protein
MNKPIAWMNAHTGHLCSGGFLMTKMQDYIPLYTHPAKTLTDEEIHDLIVNKVTDADMIKQALRKAQEK